MKEIFLPDNDANKNLPKEEVSKKEETNDLFAEAKETLEEAKEDTLELIEEAIEEVSENKQKSEDFLKQLTDVGFQWLNMARERFDNVIDELMEKGKITTEDRSTLVGSLIDETEKVRVRFEEKTHEVKEMLNERLNIKANFGQAKTSEIDLLKQRVEKLEAAVAAMKSTSDSETETSAE
mgnify:CR=1 FL=1